MIKSGVYILGDTKSGSYSLTPAFQSSHQKLGYESGVHMRCMAECVKEQALTCGIASMRHRFAPNTA